MKVIQGKQAVLRSYLTEEQCVRPIQGQDAVYRSPVSDTVAGASVSEAEMRMPQEYVGGVGVKTPREGFVQTAEIQPADVREQTVEMAAVKQLSAVPLHSVAAVMGTGHMIDVAEEDNLTIEELFSRKLR